jgi:hypothetical protein
MSVRPRVRRIVGAVGLWYGGAVLPACTAPGADDNSTHIGLDLDGALTRATVDAAGGHYAIRREETIEGVWSADPEIEFEGFARLDGNGVGVQLASHLAVLSTDDNLVVGVERGRDVDTLRPLMQGHYTWIRLRRTADLAADWGFLELDGDRFFYSSRDSDEVGMEQIPYGTNELGDGNAEISGTWELGGEDPQAIILTAGESRWGGLVDPGWGMVLQAPEGDGILLCVWTTIAHVQLTEWDGLHHGIQWQRDGGDFLPRKGAAFDIFGLEGLVWERDAEEGLKDHALEARIPIFMVGNMAFWTDESAGLRYYIVQWDGWMTWFTQPQGIGGPDGESGGGMLAWGVGVHPT